MNKLHDLFNIITSNIVNINEHIQETKDKEYKYEVYNNSKLNMKYSNVWNVRKNNIILISEGKYAGQVLLLENNSLVQTNTFHIFKIKDDININIKFVYYYLSYYINFNDLINKNNRNKILISTVRNLSIPNLSLEKQENIVNLLEELNEKYNLDDLNIKFNNYDLKKYIIEYELNLLNEVYKLEFTLLNQRNNNNIIIETFIKNTFYNYFKKNKNNIIFNKLKTNYSLQTKLNIDNKQHIIIYFDDIENDLIIKKINYNLEIKQKVIILSQKNNINDDYIFYYLKTIKDNIINKNNFLKLKTELSNIDIPLIYNNDKKSIQDFINNLESNIMSLTSYLKSYIEDNIIIERLKQLNNNIFNNIENEENIFIEQYEQTPALSPE